MSHHHYVYGLINPKSSTFYYIGKGQNRQNKQHRIHEHFQPKKLKTCGNRHKVNKIKKLRRKGYTPKDHYQKIKTGLSKEKAYELEKFLISEIGLENLTNIHEGGNGGRNKRAIEKATGETNKMSKITNQQASEIKWLINNSKVKLKKIANKYDTGLSSVSHIRGGRTWKHVDEKRPAWYKREKQKRLSPQEKRKRKKQRASEAKWLRNNTEMSYNNIAEKYDVHYNIIRRDIRKKANKLKASKPEWYNGPVIDLEKKKEERRQRIAEIKWLCENTDVYHYEIAEKYDVKKHRPSDLHKERVGEHIGPKKPNWYDENEETTKEKKIREAKEIKWLFQNTNMYPTDIAKKYEVEIGTVKNIGNEKTRKDICTKEPKWFEEGIILNERKRKVASIKWELNNSQKSHQQISKEYDISSGMVSHIKTEKNWSSVSPKKPNKKEGRTD